MTLYTRSHFSVPVCGKYSLLEVTSRATLYGRRLLSLFSSTQHCINLRNVCAMRMILHEPAGVFGDVYRTVRDDSNERKRGQVVSSAHTFNAPVVFFRHSSHGRIFAVRAKDPKQVIKPVQNCVWICVWGRGRGGGRGCLYRMLRWYMSGDLLS